MSFPSEKEFIKTVEEFEEHEKRDSMYRVATFIVDVLWDQKSNKNKITLSDGLGTLLLTWNNAFYRYGGFDFEELEKCIQRNHDVLDKYRKINILDFSEKDNETIKKLFNDFLIALKGINTVSNIQRQSPVAVAKALHLLAPNFFPLWDYNISKEYKCYYGKNPSEAYIKFFQEIKSFAQTINKYPSIKAKDRSLVKLIDEYNYAKYTKSYI